MVHQINKINKDLIQELAYEAENYADKKVDKGGEFHYHYTLKLSELIVNKCVDICNQIYFDRYPDADDFERSEEGDAILQHFGIKL